MRNLLVGTGSTSLAFAISFTSVEQSLRIVSLLVGITIGVISLVRTITKRK